MEHGDEGKLKWVSGDISYGWGLVVWETFPLSSSGSLCYFKNQTGKSSEGQTQANSAALAESADPMT